MNKSIETRMENINKELKALREEMRKDLLERYNHPYKGIEVTEVRCVSPPLMRVGAGCGNPCVLCGSGTQTRWWKPKGCLQPECDNYWYRVL